MLQNKPFFTIITPVFNRPCIDKAIRSIVEQDYENWEYIIVDDGSTDETPNILKDWEKKDKRITVITQTRNKGVSAARNIGIKKARGEYLLFLDSDDVFVSNAFLELNNIIIKNNDLDMIVFNIQRNGDNIKSIVENSYLLSKKEIINDVVAPFIYSAPQKSNIYYRPVVWNKCIKSKIMQDCNILFDENKRTWEDWEVCLKMFDSCQNIWMEKTAFIIDRASNVNNHISYAYYSDGAKHTLDVYKWVKKEYGSRFNLYQSITIDNYYSRILIWIYRTMAKDKDRKKLVCNILKDDEFKKLVLAHNAQGFFEKSIKMALLHNNISIAYFLYYLQNLINKGECF